MITDDILIHIGYDKTGTTWLQQYFFNNRTLGFHLPFDRNDSMIQLTVPHPFDFDATVCTVYMQQSLKQSADSALYPVFSHERLSGSPYSGGYDSKELADRLANIFVRPKILIVIREQVSMILSTYNQYIKMGGGMSLPHYIKSCPQSPFIRRFELIRFQYHRLIAYYQGLFGPDNVLVLPYEQFKLDADGYLKAILAFCNLRVTQEQIDLLPLHTMKNQAMPQLSINVLCRLNRIVSKDVLITSRPLIVVSKQFYKGRIFKVMQIVGNILPTSSHEKAGARAKTYIREYVGESYRESNHRTAELTGIDLKRFGYAM